MIRPRASTESAERTVHEVTVIARDAKGREHRLEAEVRTQSDQPDAAAAEVLEAYSKAHGRETVRYVEDDR